jgi:hypothetical protein
VARSIQGVALEAALNLGPERGEVLVRAQGSRELVVRVRRALLAQLE